MPSPLLVDLSTVNFDNVHYSVDDIRACNPQRFEMEQLTAICHMDVEKATVVGYKDVGGDEFWVRGHVPGRPLLPGVLMLEAAAQLCSFLYKHSVNVGPDKFLGFAGIDDVKFRGTVAPGDRLILIASARELRPRRAIFNTQGVVRDRLAFEATVIGMPL
ncbi:MAG: 3-hydroxyacyl-ACP dehydratase FabZ family protein [Candidatus Xenobia bacterium]